MVVRRQTIVVAALLALAISSVRGQEPTVLADLRPFLAAPASEMRLVVTRHGADRQALNQNFAGPGGFNMGRGGRCTGSRRSTRWVLTRRPQPLYRAAYLLGGLQLRGLRKELVESRVMTNKAFHDEIKRQGNMPMALIRLVMTKMKLTRDMDINWKFYGELPEK